jgi:hypothetical protein
MGSWVRSVPGWISPGQPGRMLVEPLLLIPFVYVYFIMIGVLFGCWVMRRLKVGSGRQTVLRFLALAFAVHVILFVGYNVPNSFIGAQSRPWPKAIQQRSYFTDYLCGPLTTKVACPPVSAVPRR